MAATKRPTARLVFYLEKVPVSAGTDTYRWSTKPLADFEYTEGRIRKDSFSEIDYALSSHDGHYAGASLKCVLDDEDGAIGALAAAEETQWFKERLCTLEILSVEGRAANLAWRPIFHGRVHDHQPGPNRTHTFEVRDLKSCEFAGLALDRPFLTRKIGAEHPDAPASVVNQAYPVLIGEENDKGTVDSAGNPADQGTMPAIFVGWLRIKDDGSIGSDGGPVYLGPPLNLQAIVVGAGGTSTLTYSVSAITATGETVGSVTVTVNDAPAPHELADDNYIELNWDPPALYGDQVVQYRINGREATPPNRYVGLTGDDATTFNDMGHDGESLPGPRESSTAIVSTPAAGGGTERAYGKLLLCLGAVKPRYFYASDLGGDDEARASEGRKPYSLESPDIISPYLDDGSVNPAWPFPDPWVVLGGIRQTLILIEGPRLQAHLDGDVTFAWGGCGYDASGNQDGPVVDTPGEGIPLLYNEFKLKNDGQGYKDGSFGPLVTFPDGTPVINTESFRICQELSKIWLGNDKGYIMSLYLGDASITTRQVEQWLALTFGWFFAAVDYGQFWATAIDDTGSLEDAKRYRQYIEIIDTDRDFPPAERRYSDIENAIEYQFGFMPDQGKFRSSIIRLADDEARTALKGDFKSSGVLELRATNDRATAEDAMARRLLRRKYPAMYQTWSTDIRGLEQKFTTQAVLVDHPGGGLGGWSLHPFFLMRRPFDPNTFHTRMTGMSIKRILEATIDWFKDTGSEFSDSGSEFR